ncbi:MAG: UDP-N-acetylglucosamine 2-epimerase [Phycisphaerales bacterium JB043]
MTDTLTICVFTGSRAEFGLLRCVMDAISAQSGARLQVVAGGSHMLEPTRTIDEIREAYSVDDAVPMQQDGHGTRADDALALGRGIDGCAIAFRRLAPDCVVVLGDRIEALAAASAASIMGVPVAHIHGGDVAEGVADDSIRHAITKLSHIHLAATEQSAERITRLGENPWRVHVVGSPSIDELRSAGTHEYEPSLEIGEPSAALLWHPVGRNNEAEQRDATRVLDALRTERVLVFEPNHDAGRAGVLDALDASERTHLHRVSHLPRAEFLYWMRRLASGDGVLVGNSSSALIEAAGVGLPAVDIGPRQAGRERGTNVIHVDEPDPKSVQDAICRARAIDRSAITHPFGDGHAGERIADVLVDSLRTRSREEFVRKRIAY